MKQLDVTGRTVVLLVNSDGRLLRTITDGDLRRMIIGGSTLETPLATLPPSASKIIKAPALISDVLAMMNAYGVDQLPAVNADGVPTELYLRRELDAPILLSTPHMGEEEREFIDAAFRSNWIAPLGPNVDSFEKELAGNVGVGHAAAVSSGTAGIHLALRLLGVGPGDLVFCSTFTFIATANPIVYQGAIPVFIDSEPESWNLSPAALTLAFRRAIESGALPKAVIVVNLYGQSADMEPICAICAKYGVPIIEDAAESLGAFYKGKSSGTFGKVGVFSFNGNKIITTSGGGMIVSNDGELIEKARFLSTQARDPAPYYQHSEIGYNYRMSNVLAGIGRGQLKVLKERVASRRAIFKRYQESLADIPELEWMPEAPFGVSTRWLSVCILNRELTALAPADVIRRLALERIEARHVWKPLHQQPVFHQSEYVPHDGRSVSNEFFSRGICLPSGSNMTVSQQDRIIRVLRAIFVHR